MEVKTGRFGRLKFLDAGALVPLLLGVVILIVDQVTKMLVTRFVRPWSVFSGYTDGWIRIVHVYNSALPFSGEAEPAGVLSALTNKLLPIVALLVVFGLYMRSSRLRPSSRWFMAGLMGGAAGNAVDRLFRPGGVLDFIDFRLYGLFGLVRTPTVNIADIAIIVCGLGLFVTIAGRKR